MICKIPGAVVSSSTSRLRKPRDWASYVLDRNDPTAARRRNDSRHRNMASPGGPSAGMRQRDHLASSLERDMRTCEDNEPDAVPGSGGFPGNAGPGTRSYISPRPTTPVLDPTWALLGVTGYHP